MQNYEWGKLKQFCILKTYLGIIGILGWTMGNFKALSWVKRIKICIMWWELWEANWITSYGTVCLFVLFIFPDFYKLYFDEHSNLNMKRDKVCERENERGKPQE